MSQPPIRYGLRTPIVSWSEARNSPWELDAGLAELTAVAEAADRLGFDVLTCPEHVAVPHGLAAWSGGLRGTRFWDPVATLAYLAGRTERIRLATLTIVIGYYHPLEVAKRYGTIDVVSNGRCVLGIGVGTAREEFDLLGAPFDDRGARADDALRALRAAFDSQEPAYHGPFFDFEGFVVDPNGVQPRLPLWIGGRSFRSLRRAVELGDGWAPQAGVTLDDTRAWLARVDPPDGFEVALSVEPPLDPITDPGHARAEVEARAAAGATTAIVAFTARSLAHYLEQLEAFTVATS